jgi:hypothetical protein
MLSTLHPLSEIERERANTSSSSRDMKRSTAFVVGSLIFLINASAVSGDENDDFIYSDGYGGDDDYKSTENTTFYERWQMDDPYFPTDDAIRQQYYSNTSIEKERTNGTISEVIKEVSRFMPSVDPIAVVSAASFFLAGIVTTIFSVAMTMYYLKLYALMRQYATQGIMVEGKMCESDPNMIYHIEKEEDGGKRGLIHIDGGDGSDEQSNHEMIDHDGDDETTVTSYRRIDNGSDESDHSEKIKEHIITPRHSNENRNAPRNTSNSTTKSRLRQSRMFTQKQRQENIPVKSKQQLATSEKFHIRRNQAPKEYVKCNQKFDCVIEYNAASDGSKIRKRMNVIGEDVTIDEDTNNSTKEFHIKLYILQNHPTSGISCGEVTRARGCHRCIIFLLCVVLGCAVIAGCAYAVCYYSPLPLFISYVVVLAIQVPLLNCFLSKSFDKVIASSYLENRAHVSEDTEKGFVEKRDRSVSFGAA